MIGHHDITADPCAMFRGAEAKFAEGLLDFRAGQQRFSVRRAGGQKVDWLGGEDLIEAREARLL
jgi:hypothetical protein